MSQPPGFEVTNTYGRSLFCKLTKALYGLKQDSRAWFEKLKDHLLNNLEFSSSQSDNCLFIKRVHSKSVYLLVYVDDIVITGSSNELVEFVIS